VSARLTTPGERFSAIDAYSTPLRAALRAHADAQEAAEKHRILKAVSEQHALTLRHALDELTRYCAAVFDGDDAEPDRHRSLAVAREVLGTIEQEAG
jgi:hypothetical protein